MILLFLMALVAAVASLIGAAFFVAGATSTTATLVAAGVFFVGATGLVFLIGWLDRHSAEEVDYDDWPG